MNANRRGDNQSDGELLNAIQSGSDEAARELYRRHNSELREVVGSFLRGNGCNHSSDHSEEVTSRAWVRIIRYLGELADINKFKQWRDAIARNEANVHLRTCIKEQNTSIELEDETFLDRAHITDYYTSRDAAIDADKMLMLAENISPDFAEIFKLRMDDLNFDEIAAQMGKNVANVRNVYYRGLRRLQTQFSGK